MTTLQHQQSSNKHTSVHQVIFARNNVAGEPGTSGCQARLALSDVFDSAAEVSTTICSASAVGACFAGGPCDGSRQALLRSHLLPAVQKRNSLDKLLRRFFCLRDKSVTSGSRGSRNPLKGQRFAWLLQRRGTAWPGYLFEPYALYFGVIVRLSMSSFNKPRFGWYGCKPFPCFELQT